ncbi:NLI interacting factor-like phosphatase family protein [Trichomonas vaginalis G3]|uniref:NLI interacting factor-like phosphatase family protein n=1 Tax=Trichomonas vaginalis (strain ATCC PRA-98 / G3) TaxID=412133 RepID=A2G9Z3_TRIV3|nr:phosphoprotein phosphatase protein [Trichomonas vaginalis G3]EAX86029.1 NLI interacting factor-like phosphatase family protein [Trichomonas vaginalis G3]KAI5517009.1 phosphoprotein phosphatase protein [Trichomonas vaginalis G3]|eukprot:XP_001298959.1 NLI interacting factor-like phosphatase family protein [Trichomonas vaginalis G3]
MGENSDENIQDIESRVISHDGLVKDDDDAGSGCCGCCCKFHAAPATARVPSVVIEETITAQKVLVLDLDETLVHCSFYPPEYHDLTLPIIIDGVQYDVYVQKRPFLDEFLAQIMPLFYVVVFTASLGPYANPIIDKILPNLPATQRLFRESCSFSNGMYVKDLDMFNAPIKKIIIVDNNPCSFNRHPANGIFSITWEGDQKDTELMDRILPILKKCVDADDVRKVIAEYQPKKQNEPSVLSV